MKLRYCLVFFVVLLGGVKASFAQLVGSTCYLQGHWVEFGIAQNGSCGPGPAPAGYHPYTGTNLAMVYDYGHDGWTVGVPPYFGDYVYPGTPFEGWAMQANGGRTDAWYTVDYAGTAFWNETPAVSSLTIGSAGCISYSNVGGIATGVWQSTTTGTSGGLKVRQSFRLDTNASWVINTVVFTNTSASAIPNVYYWRSFDPDNDETRSSNFATNNYITYQNDIDHRVMVGSYGTVYSSAYLALATKDCRAKSMIYQSWPPSEVSGNDLNLVWSQTATGLSTTWYNLHDLTAAQDIAIGLIYNLGTIAAGDSTIISYATVYTDSFGIDSAFPEPKLIVNGTAIAPSGPAPMPTYDSFLMCAHPGVTTLPINIANATDKDWSWSSWTWSPATGLSATTGTNVTITLSAVSGAVTYTITGTDSVTGMHDCANRVFYLTVVSCFAANNNSAVCMGDPLIFGTTGDSIGATYYWTNPAGLYFSTLHHPIIPSSNYSDTGTYRVVRTLFGNNDTAYTHVTLYWKPTLTLTSNSPLCPSRPDTLLLNAVPDSIGETFSWIGPMGFTSTLPNPTIYGFTAPDTGIYTLYVVSQFGCKDTAKIDVSLSPFPPTPVITGVTVYCSGDVFVPFTVAATGTVLWYTTGTGGVGTTTAPTVSTAGFGVYTFWASQVIGGCESLRDSITVTVHPTPPPPTITGTSVYCQYFPYVAPTATGVNVLWYTTATGGIGTTTPPIINTSVPGVYTIYATSTDTNCTSTRASFTITVNARPPAPSLSDVPDHYCPGMAFVPITVIATGSILWYPTASGGVGSSTAPTVNTNVPGSYTFWASQTVAGCEGDRAYVTIVVYDSVKAHFTKHVHLGCKGDTVNFTNTSTGGSTYHWLFGDGSSSNAINPTHVYHSQNVFTVTLYAASATCVDSIKDTVTLIHPLQASFTVNPDTVCQGSPIVFTNTSIATAPQYLWEFGDGYTDNGFSPSHTFTNMGVYTVSLTVKDIVPCIASTSRIVTVDTFSKASISRSDTAICRGTDITFTGYFSSIGNRGNRWNMGDGSVISNLNPVVYGYNSTGTFIVTDTAFYRVCPEVVTAVTVKVNPRPEVDLGQDTSICPGGGTIVLTDWLNAGNSAASWSWSNGQKSSSIQIGEPGIYHVTCTIGGCTTTDSIIVRNDCYMNIPNIFTPNGDGLNDYFYPRQYLTKGLTQFKMNIFNRWGELVFETASVDGRGWDGTYNGVAQPEGVYIYMITGTFIDGQKETHQGNITLLR